MKFSLIIPVFNEAEVIRPCLAGLAGAPQGTEIIVVDGGSQDNTRQFVRQAGAQLLQSEPGRGLQCNTGAARASGDVLLFLHADTRLPDCAFAFLEDFFSDPAVQIGAFRLRFDSPHPVLRLYAVFSQVDSILTRFGDQCITIRRSFFEELGGFPDWPLFEDVGLLQAARQRTRVHTFPLAVVTSSRRYLENGVIRQQLFNLWLMLRYLGGAHPRELAEAYRAGKGPHPLMKRVKALWNRGPTEHEFH